MSEAIREAPADGVGKMLQDDRFVVPNHQRDYSWKVDQVEQLFDDIEEALNKGSSAHFLGLMVFLRDGERMKVLDGQQRLATIVIILAAVRNWLQQYSDHKPDAQKIQDWFIGRSELGQRDLTPRLTLNAANNQIFADYVLKSVAAKDVTAAKDALKRQDPNRRLLEAALYAHARIDKIASNQGSPEAAATRLMEMVKFIRDKVKAVRLLVESEDAAYTIFETLNDRGLELSPLDLIKNHLYRSAGIQDGDQMRDLERRWHQMMATLSNVSADTFLRVFWTSRHGRIRSNNLFDAFKKEYVASAMAIELSRDMLNAAEHYAAIGSADDPVWAEYPEAVRASVRALRQVGGAIMHPVIMSAIARFEAREMERLLRLLEVIVVRYQLIGGGATGRMESIAATVAKDIYTGELTSASAVFQEMKELYPSDDEFRSAFTYRQESKNALAKYYLVKLEGEARRLEQGGMARELAPGELTVEHVLPRNPGPEWADELATDEALAEDCTYSLGNLCLLTHVNRDLGRKGFADKRSTFAESNLLTTKSVGAFPGWARPQIEARQQALAQLAVNAWRFA
ncbi:DUF262 domain-containing protein [Caulobacter sp. KR2-114]|uniref:DUF262 domain-containing protein n=1 Tax=Caulobacter sp. KR2-114 TaxID=3400912 RepID=UPI003C0995E3